MERRRLLTTIGASGVALGAAAVLGACTSGSDDGTSGSTASPQATGTAASLPDPRDAAADVERALLADAEALLTARPELTATLTPIRDAHAAHVGALVGTATGSATPTPTPSVAGATPTAAAAASLLALAAKERSASRLHASSASRDSVGPADARLVASLAAYAAAQDVVLTRAAR